MIRGGRWTTVAISLERFLGIIYPLKFPAKYRKTSHFIVAVLIIAVLDSTKRFYSTNKIFHGITFLIMPILTLVGLNLKILFTLFTMKDITGSSKENVLDSALVLISVVVIYLFCWTPTVVRFFYFEVFKSVDQELKNILLTIQDWTIIFNSSINFFIYCLVGKRYRGQVKKAFTCSSTSNTLTESLSINHPLPQV